MLVDLIALKLCLSSGNVIRSQTTGWKCLQRPDQASSPYKEDKAQPREAPTTPSSPEARERGLSASPTAGPPRRQAGLWGQRSPWEAWLKATAGTVTPTVQSH